MEIVVNGESRQTDAATVAQLLEALGIDPRTVAVERNEAVVPRRLYAHTALSDGDRVELVRFVQGG